MHLEWTPGASGRVSAQAGAGRYTVTPHPPRAPSVFLVDYKPKGQAARTLGTLRSKCDAMGLAFHHAIAGTLRWTKRTELADRDVYYEAKGPVGYYQIQVTSSAGPFVLRWMDTADQRVRPRGRYRTLLAAKAAAGQHAQAMRKKLECERPRGAVAASESRALLNPLSRNEKTGIVLGSVVLAGLAIWGIVAATAKPAAKSSGTTTPPGGGDGGSAPVPPSPVPGGGPIPIPKIPPMPKPQPPGGGGGQPPKTQGGGKWFAVTTLKKGARYRVSADARSALASLGFQLFTEHDAIPSDWPTADLDPSRWRIEGSWTDANLPIDPMFFTAPYNLQLWIYVPAPPSSNPAHQAVGTWSPATTLVQGRRYRASGTVRGALQSLGFDLFTDHDAVPGDWPYTDRDPARFRVDGVWHQPDAPLDPSDLAKYGGVRIFEYHL